MILCKHCSVEICQDIADGKWYLAAPNDGSLTPIVPEDEGCMEGEQHEPEALPLIQYCGPFVNVFLTDKAYGGPEEGGWWYHTGQLIRSKQYRTQELAEMAKRVEQDWCDEENKHRMSDISSVISEGRYVVYIEDEPGADFPTHRPHYE